MINDDLIVVFITAPALEPAKDIARTLVEERAAACVNILPGIHSVFRWEGEVQSESEVLMVVKTRAGCLHSRLIPLVKQLHPYELPEVIALPITDGLPRYLQWLETEISIE